MAWVLRNKPLEDGFSRLTVLWEEGRRLPQPGQFFMLRGWEEEPLLSRPFSVYDAAEIPSGSGAVLSFLFKKTGRGTNLLSMLEQGGKVTLTGPLGNGFPVIEGDVLLVGGGAGAAPLLFAAKCLKKCKPERKVSVYLGFSGVVVEETKSAFSSYADNFFAKSGGFITDDVLFTSEEAIFACGPEPFLLALYKKCKDCGKQERLFVSLEARMACGMGLCLSCTRPTVNGGRKKICADGPVFRAAEVFGDYEALL